MSVAGLFPAPVQWLAGSHIAIVVSVKDPLELARVQVQLVAADPEGMALVWARVAVPFAGDNYGAFLIPDVGSEVLVVFPAGDAAAPIVIGALWNGATAVPEKLPADAVDRWTLTGRNGTRIAIVEESAGQEMVEISTPRGAKATLSDSSSGSIELKVGSNTFMMDSEGVSIKTANAFKVDASTISLKASTVDVTTPQATFSMAVDCKTFTAVSITSSTYSPGAGNVW
ncbi:MAG TPA: phage baseplate assembly protein V [Allosphingosinicella sp.]|jgi:uncharacterized protein involved in type VI secretion and phage assembly